MDLSYVSVSTDILYIVRLANIAMIRVVVFVILLDRGVLCLNQAQAGGGDTCIATENALCNIDSA